ncbi:hypothetical protein FAI40_03400 [Acetobacteraceae bacterium]|nr:hypothetical protein FAI40_03400 [Acetobacteraceae bacterium]
MRASYLLSSLIGGVSLFSVLAPSELLAMDEAEESMLIDSAKNDKEGEQDAYQQRFNQAEEARVAEIEKQRKAQKAQEKKRGSSKQSPDVEAYLASHQGAKTALTPPPPVEGLRGPEAPMPILSAEDAEKASQLQLKAQLMAQQAKRRAEKANAQNSAKKGNDNSTGFLLGLEPHQNFSSAASYAPKSTDENLTPAPGKWESHLPGLTVDELLGETQGSLIDALELCPPSAKADRRFDVCLKGHPAPAWWQADLTRSAPKLLVEKWKALKTIKAPKEEDPLIVYADWLANMIPDEFKRRNHPEFIADLRKPDPAAKAVKEEAKEMPPQVAGPAPLNLAEAKAAFEGGLQKPQAIPSLNEEKQQAHQKMENLAQEKTESYVGDDGEQYLYPMADAHGNHKPVKELGQPKKGAALPAPSVGGVEAYRDEE